MRRLGRWLFGNAYVLLPLMALFWAGNQVLGRAVAGHIPPVAYSFLRWAGASVIILPFAWSYIARDRHTMAAHWKYLVFIGVIGGGAFNTLQYIGLNYTSALNTLVLNSTGPIFIALACVALFGDRMSLRQVLGTVVSLSGVLTVVAGGSLETLAALTFNMGDLIVLFAMATSGVYTAYLRRRPPIHWLSFLFAMFLVSALFNLPLALWEAAAGARMEVTPFTLAAVGYVAVFPSILAYICYTRGVELIGGIRAGIFMHLIPLWGALMAVGWLGEPLGLHLVAGFALIVAGVVMAGRK